MAQDHTLMGSRYELKYLIPERLALQVRDFVRQYLDLDEYCVGQPDCSYPVHSLYLDSDGWEIYWRTVNGDKNRFKLRVRYYDDKPSTPVFFEIKRRMKDVILKQRCAVRREAAPLVLSGHLPEPHHMFSSSPQELQAARRFIQLMCDLNAKPKLHVAYVREAYVNNFNNEVRLTMDRRVVCVPRTDGGLPTLLEEPYLVSINVVILELKFTDRFPDWYRELVRRFNCVQCGAAKYVEGTTVYNSRDLAEADIARTLIL